MDQDALAAKFSAAINWNASLYLFYKVAMTLLTLLFFRHLSTHDFALWSNTSSITFLALLWIDSGLKKSIPRFALYFSASPTKFNTFLVRIITYQSIILLGFTPIFYYGLRQFFLILGLSASTWIIGIATHLFVTEGLISLFRLIYHAYFWNRFFNLLITASLLCEMFLDAVALLTPHTSSDLVYLILFNKMLCNAGVIFGSICILPFLKRTVIEFHAPTKNLWKSFAKHSILLWGTTSLKSLSERNFLIPLLTYIIGPQIANIFKLANDGALLFQRTMLKTLGTADTSLLAHADHLPRKQAEAFSLLYRTTISLCSILLGILIFLSQTHLLGIILKSFTHIQKDPLIFTLFVILITGYFLEFLLLPYERFLEVKQRYRLLLQAYGIYTVGLIVFLLLLRRVHFLPLIAFLHSVKLITLGVMVYFVRKSYTIPHNIGYGISWIASSTACALVLSFIVNALLHH